MATTTCVKLKCEVKDIFDKALKQDVLEQIKKTVQPLIDGRKGLKFDPKCKDGWELTVSVSLKVDDPNSPKTIDANVDINGLHLQGSLKAFKASGGAQADKFSAKKVKQYAKLAAHDAVEGVMQRRVLKELSP
jgi:hypothetical protein